MFPAESTSAPTKPPPAPLAELLDSYAHPAYGTITLSRCEGETELVGSRARSRADFHLSLCGWSTWTAMGFWPRLTL